MVYKTRKASKSAPIDIISTMPDNVMSNILNRLRTECAVRTSILSKNWRFNWTLVTRLVFDGYSELDWRILSRILLHLRGDITKFSIKILPPPLEVTLDDEDIYHLILFVSRKGIRELTLVNNSYRILRLKLYNVISEKGASWNFITGCSLLELLKIDLHSRQWEWINAGKLKNLKKLSLSVCTLDNVNSSGVFQLTEFPPKLEDLTLDFHNCQFPAEAIVQNSASSVLCCLKSLKLIHVQFTSGTVGSSIFQLIFSSPNLQTLKILAEFDLVNDGPQSALNFDFASMRQLTLQSVTLLCTRDSENEVYLIKSLLAFSPMLKNMDIHLVSPGYHDNAKLEFALKLLKLERASPIAQINLR